MIDFYTGLTLDGYKVAIAPKKLALTLCVPSISKTADWCDLHDISAAHQLVASHLRLVARVAKV
jgi:DNA-directed RNA polymerase sigma subunit (sigma70/sigma32)